MPVITSAFSGIGGAILGAIFGGGGDDKKAIGSEGGEGGEEKPRHKPVLVIPLLGFVKLIGVGGAIYVGFKVDPPKLLAGFGKSASGRYISYYRTTSRYRRPNYVSR